MSGGGQYITRGNSWLFVPVCVLAGANFIETPMVMDIQNEEILQGIKTAYLKGCNGV